MSSYYFVLDKKTKRENREIKFEKNLVPILTSEFEGCRVPSGFMIATKELGIIDIFPKADKLRIRRTNQWISNAYQWVEKTLISRIT